jgi:hypothetical protein
MVNECLAEHPDTLTSPIDGNEIMAEFGLKPGRVVGELKNYLTNLVVDGHLDKDDREGAFAKAREYVNSRRSELGTIEVSNEQDTTCKTTKNDTSAKT